ncbi:hypothetical protein PS833_00772 [Pseudomonas fluorescens]|uniref:Lipoprotein n=1 Tax=Pseudomonas fluorescens TaxID=294 RepID=A0A5E7AJ62_PSEFL|nr:hypothetical protein PS833_00772 [Pseudomonas fluorescens]
MPKNRTRLRPLMLLVPMLLLCACGMQPTDLQPLPVTAPVIPGLPDEAKQPPAPQWCFPTCSNGLMHERENWLRPMTVPE